MSQCKEEFVFTWTIENYFFCDRNCGECICSPDFFAHNFDKTEWYLRFYPRGDVDSPEFVSMELYRCFDSEDEKPVKINFKIELCNSNDEVFAFAEEKGIRFIPTDNHFINIIETEKLEKEMENSAKDNLIVRCRMFMQQSIINDSLLKRSWTAKTEIGFNMFSFQWEVPLSQFSESYNHTVTKLFSINDEEKLSINLKAHEDDYSFEIKLVNEIKTPLLPVKCEIALLNFDLIEQVSCCAFFTFEGKSSIWHFPPFLKNSLLHKEILTDNKMLLRFNFKISNSLSTKKYTDDTKCVLSSSTVIKNLPVLSSLKDDLRAMLLSKKHSDVSFRIESEIISAHKCILASRSPVFSAMFNQEMVENQTGVIDISDMDVKSLRLFLEFLYTEEIEDLNWERALDLLLMAEKYQVFSLKEKCSEFLKNNLNTDNVCDVVSVADMVKHQILKTAAMDYIKENSTEVLGSQKWLEWIKKNVELCSEIFYFLSQEFKTILKKV